MRLRSALRSSLASLAAVLAAACVVWPAGGGPGPGPVPLTEALALRDRGQAVLVDVRSPESYAQGHIPGAVNVPARDIEARATDIRRMGRLPILYCG